MKYFKSALVFALLVIVPAGSWYYLKSGLEYRKEALRILEGKGAISDYCQELKTTKGVTSVFINQSENKIDGLIDRLNQLLNEFDDVPKFNVSQLTDASMLNIPIPGVSSITLPTHCRNKFSSMTLVDTSGTIRMTYGLEKEDFKNLVEHLAIVLPKEEEKDIIKKNYETQ